VSQEVENDEDLHKQPDHLDQDGEALEPIARVTRAEDVTLHRDFVTDTSRTGRLFPNHCLARQRAGASRQIAAMFAGSTR